MKIVTLLRHERESVSVALLRSRVIAHKLEILPKLVIVSTTTHPETKTQKAK